MKRSNFTGRIFLILAVFAIQLATAASARADVRRYLPQSIAPDTYGNFFTNFDRPIADNVKNIDAGTIKFDYNTYMGTGTPPTYGGAALAGGFFMNPGVTVKPGFSLQWIQLITSFTTFGANGRTPPYTDALPGATSPVYPYQTLPGGVNPNPAPDPAFQDFPLRNWSDGAQDWQAELALTCVENTPNASGVRQVRVTGSFYWGFAFNDTANPNHLTDRREPGLFGPLASNEFLNTMNSSWRDNPGPLPPGQDWYAFSNDTNCFALVPEPASVFLLLGALAMFARRRMSN